MVIDFDVGVIGGRKAARGTTAVPSGLSSRFRGPGLTSSGCSAVLCGRCGAAAGEAALQIGKLDAAYGQTDAVSDTDAAVVGHESPRAANFVFLSARSARSAVELKGYVE